MARRRNLKDLLTPEPTPDKISSQKSGWCMTNYHDGCRYQFSMGKCPCDCHSEPKFVSNETEKVADDNNVSDPRPWRK